MKNSLHEMRIINLTDIHFGPGANNMNITQSLQEIVYPFIASYKPDMIVIGGDDTDDKMSLDQVAARHYLQFCNTIVQFKNRANEPCAVRWIAGTESHQKGQLQALQFLAANPNLNVKLIETVSSETFMDNEILYVPEEAVEDKYTYYKDYLYSDRKFNLCFGHGLFDHIAGAGWGSVEERSLKGSPLWNIEDFKCVSGGVFFGHIHKSNVFKNFVYYGGSLTRSCQGEETPKGFLAIYYLGTSDSVRVEFIDNPLAPVYVTTSLSKHHIDNPVDVIIKDLVTYAQSNNIYDYRVMVRKTEIEADKLQILRKYFADNRNLHVRIEIQKEDANEEVIQNGSSSGGDCGSQSSESPISQSVLSRKYPEINSPEDFLFNTRYYAEKTFGLSLTDDIIQTMLAKSSQFDKGDIL